MSRLWFKGNIVLTLVLASILTATQTSADEVSPPTMRFCYENQEYRPFLVATDDHKTRLGHNGALPDLVIETTRSLGIQAEFVNYPWKRCIALLQSGEVDGIFAAIWQKEREEWGVFPKRNNQADERYSLWRVQYDIYTSKNSLLSWDGTAFSNIKSGVSAPLGYIAEQKLKQMGVLSRNSYVPSEGLRVVALNRLDGFVVESNIGDHIVISQAIQADIKKLSIPFMVADWYLPLSHQWVKAHPKLAQAFWNKLAEVRAQKAEVLHKQYALIQ
ncbi:polar amino acid transport system substrate-binding protein [Oceanospirillum multiglobuliferum]|uniref:Solute-binding protein family 3/N-terminal domain-containing protein n=1 Tax=Oceanospirillum multiglobuliferum TaxID=64969 RepID=A0A1T4QIF9_9GAMM|nr:transporter substrate-binding domain-containing protein [Oceanospirillum multiglobuliferum]OPX56391.1 hypothetical protein BTE48_02880 [Oceanospirillum multiglobuliferum]SKA03580.1 polar amino acid transport system substrate-binding protein [Oceanospirillum multiglobuliferum]